MPSSTRCQLQGWDDDIGRVSFGDLTPKIVKNRIATRKQSKAIGTVNRELAVLKRVLNWAVNEEELIPLNPLAGVSYQPGAAVRDRWLTSEEEDRLLSHSPLWLNLLIKFALHTGMRRSEMLSLRWEHVYPDQGYLVVNKSKNGKKRNIPINSTVMGILQVAGIGEEGLVFKGITGNGLGYAFVRACDRARIDAGVTWHTLRHSFATRLVQKGIDLYQVQILMGHSSFDMTKRYAHHSVGSLKAAVEVLE